MGQQRELSSPTSVSPPMNFIKNTILPSPSSENFDIPKSSVILQPPVHIENVTGSPLLVRIKIISKPKQIKNNYIFFYLTEQSSSNTNIFTTTIE